MNKTLTLYPAPPGFKWDIVNLGPRSIRIFLESSSNRRSLIPSPYQGEMSGWTSFESLNESAWEMSKSLVESAMSSPDGSYTESYGPQSGQGIEPESPRFWAKHFLSNLFRKS